MIDSSARLLVVAHGTASVPGRTTTSTLIAALRAARPSVPVSLCFLDVAAPDLPSTLATLDSPTVLVPLLLSTGYHVQTDIPAAVAGRNDVRIARHLGPDPLLIDALVSRLDPPRRGMRTVLVGAGSSRPEAAAELAETGRLLGQRRATPVEILTMTDDLDAALGPASAPAQVATYLLAEGYFLTKLRRAAGPAVRVAEPIGVHAALVELVWRRYDSVAGRSR